MFTDRLNRPFALPFFVLLAGILWSSCLAAGADEPKQPVARAYAEIKVCDAETGRGIPLVELETVNGIRFVTDNAGRIAFYEPGLMDRELFFTVRSHGYEMKKDGFGYAGERLTLQAGKSSEIKLTRRNLAERLCRLTGEGLYRDTILLGHPVPREESPNPGLVAGQDSIQSVIYRGKVYWFWGDTSQMKYPLGLFRMAGATTPIPAATNPTSDFVNGFAYDYFVDPKTRFARAMMPLPDRPEGVIWLGSLFTIQDEKGAERLVGHYSRRKGLVGEYEQGIAIFDDTNEVFVPIKQLPATETWRRPSGHPVVYEDGGTKWLLFGSPTPNVRVPATMKAVLDAGQYEAFTCAVKGPDGKPAPPSGRGEWRWQNELPPLDSKTESDWIKNGTLRESNSRFSPRDAMAPAERIVLHSGTVRWNEYRQRWVLVAGQIGGKSSLLGEVWYAEAKQPTGPFVNAVKVVTHEKQTFYNVCHHSFLDRAGGREIHFEGTYTNDFSGNADKTPRYNYNQILYRLNLDRDPLKKVRED